MIKRCLSIIALSVVALFIYNSSLFAQGKDWVWAKHESVAKKLAIDNNDNLIYFNDLIITKKDINESQLWEIIGSGDGTIIQVKTDYLGNIYVLGDFTSSVEFGGQSLSSISMYSSSFIYKFDPDGNFIFSKVIDGNAKIYSNDIDVDAYGNIAIVGYYYGVSVDFGNGIILNTHYGCDGGGQNCLYDEMKVPFIVNINSGNITQWATHLITWPIYINDGATFKKVVFDNNGNIFIAANYKGYAFYWSDDFTWYHANNSYDAFISYAQYPFGSPTESFIIKLDANGNRLWDEQIRLNNINDVATDGSNFYVTFNWGFSEIDLMNGSKVTVNGSGSGVVMKFDNNGNCLFANAVQGSSSGLAIRLDDTGNLFLKGEGNYSIAGLTDPAYEKYSNRGLFVAKFAPNFTPVWAKWLGGSSPGSVSDYEISSNGDVFVQGDGYGRFLYRFDDRFILEKPNNFSAKIAEPCTPAPTADIHCGGTCDETTQNLIVDFAGTPPWNFTYAINENIQDELIVNTTPYQIPVQGFNNYRITSLSDANCDGTMSGIADIVTISIDNTSEPSFTRDQESGYLINAPIRINSTLSGSASSVRYYYDKDMDGYENDQYLYPLYWYQTIPYISNFAFEPGRYYVVATTSSGDRFEYIDIPEEIVSKDRHNLIYNGNFEKEINPDTWNGFPVYHAKKFYQDIMNYSSEEISEKITENFFEFETDITYGFIQEDYLSSPGIEVSNYVPEVGSTLQPIEGDYMLSVLSGGGVNNTSYDWIQEAHLEKNSNYEFSLWIARAVSDGIKNTYKEYEHPIIDIGYIDASSTYHSFIEEGVIIGTNENQSTINYTSTKGFDLINAFMSDNTTHLWHNIKVNFNSNDNDILKIVIINKAQLTDCGGCCQTCEANLGLAYAIDDINLVNVDDRVPSVSLELISGMCQPGDQAQLNFNITGEPPFSLEYTINGGTPIVVNNIESNIYTIYTSTPGEYKVTKLSNYIGYSLGLGESVTIAPANPPEPSIESNIDDIINDICSDQQVDAITLSVTDLNTTVPYKKVTWFNDANSNNLLDAGELLAIHPTYEISTTGTYHALVETVDGCNAVSSKNISNIGTDGIFAVKNSNSSGEGSLRAAIEASNAYINPNSEPNQIVFCESGSPYQIVLTDADGPLPAITKSVTIDATNLSDLVEIESNLSTDANGFSINADDTEISGFYIHGFTGLISFTYGQTTGCGIATEQRGNISIKKNVLSGNVCGIFADAHKDMTIYGNYIGTDITGTSAFPNQYGIYLHEQGPGTNSIIIGGYTANEGNIISGNSGGGIYSPRGCYSTYIIGNKIGVNINNEFLGNGDQPGISMYSAWSNTIGGSEVGATNIIASSNEGIKLGWSDGGCKYNKISRNLIYNGTKGIFFDNEYIDINDNKQPPTITGGNSNEGIVSGTSDWEATAHLGDIVELFRSDVNGINAFEYIGEGVVQDGGTWEATGVNLIPNQTNYVIATITDVKDYNAPNLENTSEFSGMYTVVPSLECPTITSIFPSEVCHDEEVTFEFTHTEQFVDETYLWDLGDGTTSTEKNPVHIYINPGVYQVVLTVTMIGCDDISYTTDLTVNYELAISGLASQYYLDNLPKVITGTPAGGEFTGTSIYYNSETGVYTFVPEVLGMHDITYTYTNGSCSSYITQQVNVIEATQVCPTITSISPSEVCHDEEVTFEFTHTETFVDETYLWDLGNGTTSIEKNPVHTYVNPGTYQVSLTASMDGCNDAIYNTELVVNYEVAIIGLPNEYLYWSEAVALTGSPAGGVFTGNDFINDLGNGVYTFSPEELGNHDITYTYTVGSCSNSITQQVNVFEETRAYLSGNAILCNGSTTTDLTVNYTGTGEWSFTCNYKDNLEQITPITQTGISGSSYTITGCAEGYYTLVSAQNINGDISTGGPVNVVSRQSPVALLDGSGTVCREEEAPVYIDFTQGAPPYNFTYKIGDLGEEQSGTSYNDRYEFTDPIEGTYYLLSVTDFYCPGSASGTVDVSFNDLPDVSITGIQADYCEGDPSVIFLGNPEGGYYSGYGFTFNDDGTASFNPDVKGIYRVTYTYTDPVTGCTNSASQFVRVHGISVATLSGDGKICGEGMAVLNVELSGADSYFFTYTDGTNMIDVELTETMVTSDPFNYSLEVSVEGDYSLTHVESGGCIGTAGSEVITVIKRPLPEATITPGIDETICQGETVPVEVNFSGTGPWYYRLGILSGYSTIELISTDPTAVFNLGFLSGEYYVVSIRDQYCEGIGNGSAKINVLSLPTAELTGNGAICESETAVMTVEFSGTGPWHFKYSVDGVEITDEITVDIPSEGEPAVYVIEATDPAEYKLEYVRNNECSGTVSGIINVEHYPKPTLSMSGGGEIYLEEQAEIQFALTGNGPYRIWYAIDGIEQFPPIFINETSPDLLYTFLTAKPGVYTIVNYEDAYCVGDEITDEVTVTIIGEPLPCKECISSFAPIPGEKYVLGAWIKQSALSSNGSYADAGIEIDFEGANETTGLFLAKGAIIDGWQRIEEEFVIPFGTTAIHVNLTNNSTSSVYFDDIRIHPFKANMKSYVYDPITMKLSAELDENNYATYYEYNEEGALVRIKKETERGVKTIQESFSNKAKGNE